MNTQAQLMGRARKTKRLFYLCKGWITLKDIAFQTDVLSVQVYII